MSGAKESQLGMIASEWANLYKTLYCRYSTHWAGDKAVTPPSFLDRYVRGISCRVDPDPLEEMAALAPVLGSVPSETEARSCSWRGDRDCRKDRHGVDNQI